MQHKLFLLLNLLFTLFFGEIRLAANTMLVRQFPFFHQLPSNEIWAVYQDKQGFLWIGTTDGVARYDGFQVQTFKNDYRHPDWMTDNRVAGFAEDRNFVWIGTAKGVTLFNKDTWQLVTVHDNLLKYKPVSAIISGTKNDVWIASEGAVYHCGKGGKIQKEYHPEGRFPGKRKVVINSLYKDNKGTVWAVMDRDGLCRYNSVTDSFVRITDCPDVAFFTMMQDGSGRYWIGTWGNGLWEYFPYKRGIERFKYRTVSDVHGVRAKSVFSIAQDNTFHYLWLLSYEGLVTLKVLSDGSLQTVNTNPAMDSYKMFTRIFKDREGNLWLSAYDQAYIVSFDNSGVQNYTFPELKSTCMYDVNFQNLCLDNGGFLWMEQDRFGLCLWNGAGQAVSVNTDDKGRRYEAGIICKSESPNTIWACERMRPRLLRLQREGSDVHVIEDVWLGGLTGGQSFKDIQEDMYGNLWLLTSDRLLVKPQRKVCRTVAEGKDVPDQLASDGKGRVWAVSMNSHCIKQLNFNGDRFYSQNISFSIPWDKAENIKNFVINNKGYFWLFSSLGNVYQGILTGRSVQKLSFNGLLDDCSLLKALTKGNNLWVLTNNKLIRYDYTRRLWNVYRTTDDNIQVDVFRGQALIADGKGGVFAGGHNGLIHVPAEGEHIVVEKDVSPRVTDVKIQNQSAFFSSIREERTMARKVFLTPGSRNIELSLSSLKYGVGEYHELSYKLEGVDKNWIMLVDNRHTAFYNQLEKGTYQFRMRYRNNYGQWVESNVPLTLVQLPHFYETWYAELFYLLILIGIGYGSWRKYRTYLRRKNDKRLKKIVALTRVESLSDSSEDKHFLQSVADEIGKYMDDSDFDLDKLAGALMISKSTLHRKIKTLTGLTPLDFIRSVKMKKASELLLIYTMNISEVAYAVGYSNPKYFTRCFKDEFGETPTQYQQSHANQK